MRIFTFKNDAHQEVFCYKWDAEGIARGVIQIAHGMAEGAGRYDRFALELARHGYVVYSNDHRGHGKTAGSPEKKGQIGSGGFMGMIRDMKALNDIIAEDEPGLPVYLLGHSMGSILTQGYISLYGDTLKGAILSGTSGRQPILTNLGLRIAKSQVKSKGFETPSEMLTKMSFGQYNKGFKPTRTEYDWLSRDSAEVDAYINNPYCGGVFPAGFYLELFKGLKEIQSMESTRKIPKKLPIYIFSGDKDPVGKNTKTIVRLIKDYKSIGIEDVEYRFYKDGRHEMLNEINRDEVIRDVVSWLKRH